MYNMNQIIIIELRNRERPTVRNIADSIGNFAGIWQPNHLKRFLC
jgi:hypothetical protein